MKTYPINPVNVNYSRHRSNFLNQIQSPQLAALTAAIVGIIITFACSKGMYLTALLALIGLLLAFPKVLLMLYGKSEQLIRHYKYSPFCY